MAVLGVLGGGAVPRADLEGRLAALEQMRNVGRARLQAAENEAREMTRAIAQADGAIMETQMWLANLDGQKRGENQETVPDTPPT